MLRKKSPEELSVEELRRLLVEKRRTSRQDRLDHFRKTGRVVALTPELEQPVLAQPGYAADDSAAEPQAAPKHPKSRKTLDGFLLVVEILAVLGLVFVLFNGLEIIRQLNQEVALALEQPTLTPTPLVQAVVLPSGHTPPNAEGGAQPNDAEIPAHLLPLVQSQANVPIPTPGPGQANRIQIPAINVDAPVVQGDGWEQLKKGVGQHIGTANPGNRGNVVLSAHNDIFGEIFRYLDELQPGDEIILHTGQRAYVYVVTNTQVVEPTDVAVMGATSDSVVTLISCYPYLIDDQRIVVQARLKSGSG